MIADQVRDPLMMVLLVAAVLTLATGDLTDAGVILLVIVVNTTAGVTQEVKAGQAIAALSELTAPDARVLRDGAQRPVPAAEVVPGDLQVLAEGDIVPADADAGVTDAAALLVDESALTGESVPADKAAGRHAVSAGTTIVRGRGRGGGDGHRCGQRDGADRRPDGGAAGTDPAAAAAGRRWPDAGSARARSTGTRGRSPLTWARGASATRSPRPGSRGHTACPPLLTWTGTRAPELGHPVHDRGWPGGGGRARAGLGGLGHREPARRHHDQGLAGNRGRPEALRVPAAHRPSMSRARLPE